jgi:hypothetical protein
VEDSRFSRLIEYTLHITSCISCRIDFLYWTIACLSE